MKMTEEEKITREEHPKRIAQGRKLAAFMKKRKEEELRRKGTTYRTVFSTAYSTVYSTVK